MDGLDKMCMEDPENNGQSSESHNDIKTIKSEEIDVAQQL